jgi:small GTP-binding protein
VIIVYDVTDPSSFQDVDKFWVPEIENYATNGIGIILLGNKCDCEKAVDTEKANTYATFKGYDFQEVSAKTADNIF